MSYRPVDLGIPNSIIQAFTQGRQLALEKQQLQQEKELKQQQLEQEHEHQQNLIKVHQRQLDLESAMHDIAKLQAQQSIGEAVTKGAPLPSGSQVTGIDYGQTGEAPKTLTFTHPDLGQMTVEHPEEYKRSLVEETGKLAEAKEAPERKTKFGVADLTTQRDIQLELGKLIQGATENEKNRQNRLDVADVNGQYRLAAAKARGTSNHVANLANTISQQYDNSPITKSYHVLQAAKATADDPNSSDYELTNAYARAQNPDIAADIQGQLGLIQQLPAFATQLGSKLDIFSNKQFLDEPSRKQARNYIQQRFGLQEKALDALKNSHGDRLKNIGEDPKNWLMDHSQQQTGPKIGDTKTFANGKKGKWDGTGWELIP